ncbi:MAG: hypothetical protein H7A41_01465 [Chlamydiales bacterium]|nr:hypothetical protein [Chlamydiales bacterium]
MSEVERVEGSYTPVSEMGSINSEPIEQSEKAVTAYQDPGVNSGWLRMKEEGVMIETASPEVRAAKQKMALAKKLEDLEPLMKRGSYFQDTLVIPVIVRLVAPYDPVLAQSYANRLRFDDWGKAIVELLRHVPSYRIQFIWGQIKQKLGIDQKLCDSTENLILVCREAALRGLEGKEKILQLVERVCSKHHSCEFAELLMDFKLKVPSDFLEEMHLKTIEMFSKFEVEASTKQSCLLKLLKVEARAMSPFVFETLELLRDNTKMVYAEYLNGKGADSRSSFAAWEYIRGWMNIIGVEATTPFLSSELDKDVSFLFKTLKELKQKHPEEVDSFDFLLGQKIDQLVTYYPSKVLEILDVIEDRDTALVHLIKAGHPNKYQFLEELVQEGEEEPVYIDLFSCVALLRGVEQALPYLEKAKLTLSEVNDGDDEDLQSDLADILEVELAYHLPSAQQTLETLREVFHKTTVILPEAMKVFVEAELSLLIDSF